MLILWRGWGILVPVIFFGVGGLGQLAIDRVGGPGTYTRFSAVLFPLLCACAAGLVWWLGRTLNRRDSPEATSNFHVAHSFMILRMEYWAVVFGLAALAGIVSRVWV